MCWNNDICRGGRMFIDIPSMLNCFEVHFAVIYIDVNLQFLGHFWSYGKSFMPGKRNPEN